MRYNRDFTVGESGDRILSWIEGAPKRMRIGAEFKIWADGTKRRKYLLIVLIGE